MKLTRTDSNDFRRKMQMIAFGLLLMSGVGLIYLTADSDRISASLAAARISRALDSMEPSAPSEAALPVPASQALAQETAEPAPAAQSASAGPRAEPIVEPPKEQKPAGLRAASALTMLPTPSIGATGACYALENFKSPMQARSAKALIASGPLRGKAWAVSTPRPARFVAGVEAKDAASARRIAKEMADRGLEPLSMSSDFIVMAKSDSAEAAMELAATSLSGMSGYVAKARQVAPATERRSLVVLAQTRGEVQLARSLPNRLPGSTLSAAPCPPQAFAAGR